MSRVIPVLVLLLAAGASPVAAQEREPFPPAPNPVVPLADADDDDDDDESTPSTPPATPEAPTPILPLAAPNWHITTGVNAGLAEGGAHSIGWKGAVGAYGSVGSLFDYAFGAYSLSTRTVDARVPDLLISGGSIQRSFGNWTIGFTGGHQWVMVPTFGRTVQTYRLWQGSLDYEQPLADTPWGRLSLAPSLVAYRSETGAERGTRWTYSPSIEMRLKLDDRLTELRFVAGFERKDYDFRPQKRIDDSVYLQANWVRSLSHYSFIVGRVEYGRTWSTIPGFSGAGWTANLVWYFSLQSEGMTQRAIERVLRDRRSIF